MLAEYKTKTNIGIGLGIVGQFVGRALTASGGSENPAVSFLGVAVIIGAIVAFVSLAGVEFGEHQKFTLRWALATCAVLAAAAMIGGVFPLRA